MDAWTTVFQKKLRRQMIRCVIKQWQASKTKHTNVETVRETIACRDVHHLGKETQNKEEYEWVLTTRFMLGVAAGFGVALVSWSVSNTRATLDTDLSLPPRPHLPDDPTHTVFVPSATTTRPSPPSCLIPPPCLLMAEWNTETIR